MRTSLEARIAALEHRHAPENAELVAALIRAVMRTGSVAAAVAALEAERGPLKVSAEFLATVESRTERLRARLAAMDRLTGAPECASGSVCSSEPTA